jgi:hypothetical protein
MPRRRRQEGASRSHPEAPASGKRLRLTDNDRCRLAARGHALGRKLQDQFASIASPDSILRWP